MPPSPLPDDPPELPVPPLPTRAAVPPAHRWGFGAFLLVESVLLLSAVLLSAILDPGAPTRPAGVMAQLIDTIVPTALAAGVAVLVTMVRGNGPVADLGLVVTWPDLKVGFKLGLAGVGLTILAVFVWTRVVGSANATSAISAVSDGHHLSLPAASLLFVYLWFIGPIFEEIIFRGLLWGAIQRQQWGRWPAFGLSTAIFAASHLEPLRTTLLLVISIPIGLARLLTGRLPASVVAHQVNNFLPALATLLVGLGVMTG